MQLLENKIALVTGGSKGIGESIVRAFAKQGAKVIFTYLSSEERALNIEKEIISEGNFAKAIKCDGTKLASVEILVNEVIKEFGGINILVNNAGITRDNLLLRMSEMQWDEIMDSNLKSVFSFSKYGIKTMLRNGGSIINISSIVGIRGNAGQSNYAASKAGIIGFSKSVALELGVRNIRCNVIAPGFVQTEMTEELAPEVKAAYVGKIPLNRFGQVNEIAKVATFLASDMSSYVTGQVISVCGGMNI
ncbi:MAG: 3-oxoacyl-[acyl-carrier-protein] reductase [Bacteroidetes bacterium]|nr:3-oxoacyl-[acyl-carrier-protein] reductase [Bacteroidota bacterium]